MKAGISRSLACPGAPTLLSDVEEAVVDVDLRTGNASPVPNPQHHPSDLALLSLTSGTPPPALSS